MNNTINELRNMLFDTLRDLREGKIDIDRAHSINDTAQTIINSAKVEVDHMRVAGGSSAFIAAGGDHAALPDQQNTKTQNGIKTITHMPNGATVTRHRMAG